VTQEHLEEGSGARDVDGRRQVQQVEKDGGCSTNTEPDGADCFGATRHKSVSQAYPGECRCTLMASRQCFGFNLEDKL